MTKEEKFVVNPLEQYFLDSKRSGAKWKIKDRPKYGKSATGWDLQIVRHNQVLLIEAKYIRGAFASSFAGLTIAPLSNRPEKMTRGQYRSWSAVICWAIGSGYKNVGKYKMRNVYQILFNYLARNLNFWQCYSETLKVKYIFFVDNQGVAKISFNKIINLAAQYKPSLGKSLFKRRTRAEELLRNLDFK